MSDLAWCTQPVAFFIMYKTLCLRREIFFHDKFIEQNIRKSLTMAIWFILNHLSSIIMWWKCSIFSTVLAGGERPGLRSSSTLFILIINLAAHIWTVDKASASLNVATTSVRMYFSLRDCFYGYLIKLPDCIPLQEKQLLIFFEQSAVSLPEKRP